jgi:hypothetical protein
VHGERVDAAATDPRNAEKQLWLFKSFEDLCADEVGLAAWDDAARDCTRAHEVAAVLVTLKAHDELDIDEAIVFYDEALAAHARGRDVEAGKAIDPALAAFERHAGDDDEGWIDALDVKAHAALALGDAAAAKAASARATMLAAKIVGVGGPAARACAAQLAGEVAVASGARADADAAFADASRIYGELARAHPTAIAFEVGRALADAWRAQTAFDASTATTLARDAGAVVARLRHDGALLAAWSRRFDEAARATVR